MDRQNEEINCVINDYADHLIREYSYLDHLSDTERRRPEGGFQLPEQVGIRLAIEQLQALGRDITSERRRDSSNTPVRRIRLTKHMSPCERIAQCTLFRPLNDPTDPERMDRLKKIIFKDYCVRTRKRERQKRLAEESDRAHLRACFEQHLLCRRSPEPEARAESPPPEGGRPRGSGISSERWRGDIQRVESPPPANPSLRPDSRLQVAVSSNPRVDPNDFSTPPEERSAQSELRRRYERRNQGGDEREFQRLLEETVKSFAELRLGNEERAARRREKLRPENQPGPSDSGPNPENLPGPSGLGHDPENLPGPSSVRRSARLITQKRKTETPRESSECSDPKARRC